MDHDEDPWKRTKIASSSSSNSQDVSSVEWEFINMSQQEEDLINRMYRLVGDRWDLIAGRVWGRKAEEIERFWLMRQSKIFDDKRKEKVLI